MSGITEYAQLVITVLACLGAVGAAWVWVYRRVVQPAAAAIEAVKVIVEMQLTANGGGSLVDKVNQIAPNHAEAQGHWNELKDGHEKIKASIEERGVVVDGRITKLEQTLSRASVEIRQREQAILNRLDTIEGNQK